MAETTSEMYSMNSLLGETSSDASGIAEDNAGLTRPLPTKSLYASHFLTTLNSRTFEFGATLFVASLFSSSLTEVSVYAIARSLAAIVFSSTIGNLVDHGNRRAVVRQSIVFQRVATCISYGLFLVLTFDTTFRLTSMIQYVILGFLCLLAAVEKLASTLNLVSVERDWVPVLAQGERARLQELNAHMRRIDLCCKLAGPLIIGWLEVWSIRGAILLMGAINVASVFIELITIDRVWSSCQDLASRHGDVAAEPSLADEATWNLTGAHVLGQCGSRFFRQLHTYFISASALPSFALSILYLTVLSFNGQMVAYLLFSGTNSGTIATYRMVASISELSATWLAPFMINAIGPIRSGSWSINVQMLCLTATAVIFWQDLNKISSTALVIGVISSRAALWSFDLSAQVIIQEEVEEDRRGAFSATEAMFQNAFELLAFLSTLIWSDPSEFRYPVSGSALAVLGAAAIYTYFVRKRRGHLLHYPCMPKSKEGWSLIRQNRV